MAAAAADRTTSMETGHERWRAGRCRTYRFHPSDPPAANPRQASGFRSPQRRRQSPAVPAQLGGASAAHGVGDPLLRRCAGGWCARAGPRRAGRAGTGLRHRRDGPRLHRRRAEPGPADPGARSTPTWPRICARNSPPPPSSRATRANCPRCPSTGRAASAAWCAASRWCCCPTPSSAASSTRSTAVAPGRGFLHYSYCVTSPLPYRRHGLTARREAWTPLNVPPASVWRYQAAVGAPGR